MTDEIMKYAGEYQAKRHIRNKEKGALFLPMEVLRNIKTDQLNLSVSFSGTGFADTYVSQNVSLYRAVKIKLKWLIIPTTVSRVLNREEFLEFFGEFLLSDIVDGEEYWVIKKEHQAKLRKRIKELKLDNSFREIYKHAYLPDSA